MPLAVQRGIHFIDDLLGVHADRMNGSHHDQHEEHEDHRVLTDVLTFFSPDLRPKPTQHLLPILAVLESSTFPLNCSAPETSHPGRSPLP